MGEILMWTGCYGNRGDLFTVESNRHPAKMAVGLCYRIFEHMSRRGWLKPGDTVLDPMAGIFTTGIVGATLGYKVLGIELESHFVEMAKANIELLRTKMPGAPAPVVVQGDARWLRQVLASADAAITSPPYVDQTMPMSIRSTLRQLWKQRKHNEAIAGYKQDQQRQVQKGQKFGTDSEEVIRRRFEECIEREQGNYSGVVSSPPYAESLRNPSGIDAAKEAKPSGPHAQHKIAENYDAAVTSPPYSEALTGGGICKTGHFNDAKLADRQYKPDVHGHNPAQIGNLRDPKGDIECVIDGVLSSPPYGGTHIAESQDNTQARRGQARWVGRGGHKMAGKGKWGHQYSRDTQAQLANLPDEQAPGTYLAAMLQVYGEVHTVLRPGGVVALVTKNPVKAGKIRRLDDDTIRLCEAVGFRLVERVRAMLSEDLGEQTGMKLDYQTTDEEGNPLSVMVGAHKRIRRERFSFFKRLHIRKHPELAVRWEDILFFQKQA
jgi:hypothetical protein